MPITNFSGWFSKKLLAVLFILAISPASLVTASASRQVPVSAYFYLGFLPISSQSQSPRLLTQNNSTRALALNANTFLAEPFSLSQLITFGTDSRTRLVLFATNIDVPVGENPPALTADAENWNHTVYALQVEYVDRLGVSEPTYAIHVRLNDAMVEDGDVLVRLYFNGVPSNRVRVGLGRMGGGLADDGASQITQLSPSSITAGGNPFTLSITGSSFTPDAKPFFNGIQHAATVASESLLLVPLSSSDVQTAASYAVHVQTSAGVSNSVSFNVNNPQPEITGLSPSNVINGGSGFTLSVNGSGFVQGSVVNFNGSSRVTTFVSATLLTAQILASDLAGAGSFPVTVVNAAPGGGTSASIPLVVVEPAPSPTPSPIPSPTPSGVISYATAIGRLSLAPSKTAYYRFSETSGTSVADSSGGSHTGTLLGPVTLNQASLLAGGDSNPSALFDGGKVLSPSFMPALTTGLTLSCLFRPTAWPAIANRYAVVALGTSSPNGFFTLNSIGGLHGFSYSFKDTAGNTVTFLFPVLQGTQLNRIYHLAVTHDFGTKTVKLYLDGMLVSTQTYTQTPKTVIDQPVQVGLDNVTGYIDEALVAGDRVLTDTEVRSLVRAVVGADQSATEFYVSPTGTPRASGAIGSPLDLTTALRTGLPAPGQTYWLRGGTYGTGGATVFYSILQGTASAPIIVRGYPGERATVDGGINSTGPYTWFWGFEIMNSDTNRTPSSAGGTTSARPPGISMYGRANKAINMVIHDTGHPGIGFWDPVGDGGEIYGTLLYHIGVLLDGVTPTGSGIYAQNSTGTRYIKDVIAFRNWTTGFKAYTEQDHIDGFDIEGNIAFNNNQWDIFIVSKENPAHDLKLISNYTYQPPGRPEGVQLGYYGNHDMYSGEVRNNYFVANGHSPFYAKNWTNLVVDNNTFIGSGKVAQWNTPVDNLTPITTGVQWGNNTYYHGSVAPAFFYNNTNLTFSNWKTATGFDRNSTLTSGRPTSNQIFIRPNQYELGRANIAIYNWQNLSSVSVNLSTAGLVNGQAYEVRDAQNFYGARVVSGTYSSSSPTVNIPMTGLVAAPSVGTIWTTVWHTAPNFGAFVVLPSGTAPHF